VPARPARPCKYPGCGELARGRDARCPEHAKKQADTLLFAPPRALGSTRVRQRKELFRKQPLCVECLKVGRVTLATIRDHIVALTDGGLDVPENTQPLCHDCHVIKTNRERAERWKGA
jgi:5-methylcytosine-specific restriction protein A